MRALGGDMRKGRLGTFAMVLLCAATGSAGARKDGPRVTITIYSPGAAAWQAGYGAAAYRPPYPTTTGQQQAWIDPNAYAVVTERRTIQVVAGSSEIRVAGVPAQIDPTT